LGGKDCNNSLLKKKEEGETTQNGALVKRSTHGELSVRK